MGKKRAEEDKGKLARYVNTPENMALFRRLYQVPDDVGLRYVHWSDALPPSAGELLIPVVAVVEGGIPRRRKPRKNLVKINSLRQVWECEHCTDDWSQPRAAAKLLRYTARTHSYLDCRLVPDLEATKANPENDALPAVDIRDVIDGTAPDMTGINLRNLLPTRRDEGTSVGAPSSSRPASRKRGRTEGTAGPSRPTVDPLPSSSVPEPPSTDQQVTQLGNVIRAGMVIEVRLPVGPVASALSQAVRLPLDMGEWKKTPDEELINNMRRGALMGVQASLELEERFRTTKEHLAHANVLALRYQDARNAAAEAKRLAEEADSKRKEAEESLTAALDSLTKAQDRIRALESEFDQAKKASYEAGNNDAQAEMGEQLPGVCNEFFSDGWKKALSTDIVNLEDEESPAEGAVPEDAVLEDAVPEDAAQAPSAGEGGGAAPDEAGPDAQ
uniref:Uncharacterized protein n=1 Tax=Fagus sylvatica TaxID=28930 RepID=A0A2N9HJN4_FAGSY